jgi:hypothetical protein
MIAGENPVAFGDKGAAGSLMQECWRSSRAGSPRSQLQERERDLKRTRCRSEVQCDSEKYKTMKQKPGKEVQGRKCTLLRPKEE